MNRAELAANREAKQTKIAVMIGIMAILFVVIMLFHIPSSQPTPHNEIPAPENFDGDGMITSLDKAIQILKEFPVVDSHNDFAFNVRILFQNQLSKVNFSSNLRAVKPWVTTSESHTDIPRLRRGHVGGVFWVAFTPCSSQGKDAVIQTLEQIDLIHRLVDDYPNDLYLATTSKDLLLANKTGKIASFIGVEGGHSISSSPAVLRTFYKLGVRYLTLTHQCNTPWADSSFVDMENPIPSSNPFGLSEFGEGLIYEMNRIGMMVDLSHVSVDAMRSALKISKAPVIFSHSGAKAICNHHRNVLDDILKLLKLNRGIIMVNFYNEFVNSKKSKNASLHDVADHLDHIKNLIGVEHVGLGTDYDGVPKTPQGLEDVSKFPQLFAELIDRGWNKTELSMLSFLNILEVMRKVEQVKIELASESPSSKPMESVLPVTEIEAKNMTVDCQTDKALGNLIL